VKEVISINLNLQAVGLLRTILHVLKSV